MYKKCIFFCISAIATGIAIFLLIQFVNKKRNNYLSFPADKIFRLNEQVGPIAITPDGNSIAWISAFDYSSGLNILSLQNGTSTPLKNRNDVRIHGIATSPDGKYLVIGVRGKDGSFLAVWDIANQICTKEIPVDRGFLSTIVFDKDGKSVYTGSGGGDGIVRLVDIESGTVENIFTPQDREGLPIDSDLSIGAIALAPDGNELAIGLRTGVVIWNYRVKESRFYISDEKCIIASLAISPDGHYLAIRGDSAELWDYQKGQKIGDLPSPNLHSHMSKIKFSPDGKLLVASLNGPINFPSEIGVWQTKDFSRSFLFSCQEDVITSMAFIPGTNTLVTGSSDCSIRLWDLNKISWANEKTEKNKNRQ